MEILLVLLLGAGVLYYLYKKMNQPESFDSTGSAPHGVPTLPAMPEPQPAPTVEAVQQALDVNKDGKVDLADAKEVVKKTRARVKKAADLDGDGRVTIKDVKVAATRARKTANTVADRAAKAATKSAAKPKTKK
jgi:hypothetical protein